MPDDPFDAAQTILPPSPAPNPAPSEQTPATDAFTEAQGLIAGKEQDPAFDQQALINHGLTDSIDPTRAARVYKQSQTIPQLPPDFINRNLDDIESWTSRPGYDAEMGRVYLQNSPAVAKYIADNPYAARLVAPDLKDTAAWWNLEGAAPALFSGFSTGWTQGSLALARNEQGLGVNNADLNRRILDLETTAAKSPDGAGWLHTLRGVGTVFGSLVPSLEGGAVAAVPTAAAGALVGAAAGAPEGGVGAIPGAIVGGLAAGRAGFTAGFAATLFQATAGDAYHSLSEHVDANGNPLDETTKRGAATVIALGNTALMMLGVGRVASFVPKSLGPAMATPTVQAALGRFNNAATRFAVGYGQTMTEQAAVGGAMGAVNNFGERMADYAANVNGGKFQHDDSALGTTFAGAIDGASNMLETMAIPSILGGIAHARAKPPELPAPPRLQDARNTANAVAALGQQIADSKMGERAPDAAGAVVQNMAHQNGTIEVGIPTAAWNAHFAADGRDPAAEAARVTGDPQAYLRATSDATDLRITAQQWATGILATKDHEALAPHTRMSPDTATLGEVAPEEAKAATGKPVEPTTAGAPSGAAPESGKAPEAPPASPPEPLAVGAAPAESFGRPDLQNPGRTPETRAFWDQVDEVRKSMPTNKAGRDANMEAAKAAATGADADSIERDIVQRRALGKGAGDALEQAKEKAYVQARVEAMDAMPEGPEKDAEELRVGALASLYRQGRSIASDVLRQDQDEISNPTERRATARLRVAEKADPGLSDRLRAAEQALFEAERARAEGERSTRAAETPKEKPAPESEEKNSSATLRTNKPSAETAPKSAARRKELKASRDSLFAQLKELGKPPPSAGGSGRVGPRSGSVPLSGLEGLPDIKNLPAALKVVGQIAANYAHDGVLAFPDFVRDVLKAVPGFRMMADVHAKLDEFWDAAKGIRDTTAAAIARADEHGRAMLRYERTARLWQALTEKFNADAKAIAGMSAEDAQAFLDNEGKKSQTDIPPEIQTRLDALKADMNDARQRWQSAKAAVEAARRTETTPEESQADAEANDLQTKIDRAQAAVERKIDSAAKSDQERLEEILSNRAAKAAERAAMPQELRDLHDLADELSQKLRVRDARITPKEKDQGPEPEREHAELQRRLNETREKIHVEVERLWTDPKERAEQLAKIKEAGIAKRKADREALPVDLKLALDTLEKLREERRKADSAANKASKPEKSAQDLADEALGRLVDSASQLRDRLSKSDPERRAEMDRAKAELAATKAAEPEDLKRVREVVAELRKQSAARDRGLEPKKALSPVDQAVRDLRREQLRAVAIRDRESALNEKLKGMTPEQRRAHLEALANEPEAETPDEITRVREESAKRIKLLMDERKRLAEEGMSEQDHEAAIIRGIQRTLENSRMALQAKRDKYLSMTYEERKQMAIGKLPTVQGLMTKLAAQDLSPLHRQIRDLELPPDVAEMKKRIETEANARTQVNNIRAQLGKQAAARKAKLLHDGFDLDNPDAEWLKDPAKWDKFKQALAKTDGNWADKVKELVLANLHASVVLGPVKALSDVISIHTEMATRTFQAASQGQSKAAAEAWGHMYTQGMPAALRALSDSFHNGLSMADATPWGDMHSRYGYISGTKGDIARFSFRVVSAIDQASKAMAAYGVVGMEAAATGAHLSGDALAAHLASEIADHKSESWERARLFAQRATFTENNSLADRIRGTFDKPTGNPGLDRLSRATGAILFPFARVPLNIMGRGISYAVPGASLAYHTWDESQRPTTGTPEEMKTEQARRDDRRRNDLVRAGFSSLVYAALGTSGITQAKDSQGRPILTGWADKDHPTEFYGFNYGRLGPAAQAIGMMVDVINALHHGLSVGGTSAEAVTAIKNHMVSDSFLRTVSSVGNALDEHSAGGGALAFAVSLLSAATPAVAREAIKNLNPNEVTRAGESLSSRAIDALTGGGGQPRVTPFGHVVSKGTTGNAVSDFMIREVNPAKLGDSYDLSAAGHALSAWNRDHPSEAISEKMPNQTVRVDDADVRIPTPSYQAALRDGGQKAGAYVEAYLAASGISATNPTPAARDAMEHALQVYRNTAVRAKADPDVVERSLSDAQAAGEYDATHEIGNWDRGHAKQGKP